MKDYYALLGITRYASADEIKRAYRKKVKEFHPDVNKKNADETIIRDLNEAYELLNDSAQRARYDEQFFSPPASSYTTPVYETHYAKPDVLPVVNKLFYRVTFGLTFLFLLMLSVDFFWVKRINTHTIERVERIVTNEIRYYATLDNGETYFVGKQPQDELREGHTLSVEKTYWLHVPLRLITETNNVQRMGSSLYQNLIFFPILLTCVLVVGIFIPHSVRKRDVAIGCIVLTFFTIVFLLLSY